MYRVLIYILLALPSALHATDWGETEVDDPILNGEKCSIHEPISWGGYIYRWPSKYDQVFWPMTDIHGIWFCEKSGFTAFIGDFDGLNDIEKERIKELLETDYKPPVTIEGKLNLLEKIYGLRKKDDAFKNKLLRVLARWHQNLDDNQKANTYRRAALKDIIIKLEDNLPEMRRLEYLYLAMNYSLQFGETTQANKYQKKLELALSTADNEKVKGLKDYLLELIPDSKGIKQGGALDPVIK